MFDTQTSFKDSLFYDVSAWTFPLAFNLNYAELKSEDNIGDLVTDLKLESGEIVLASCVLFNF